LGEGATIEHEPRSARVGSVAAQGNRRTQAGRPARRVRIPPASRADKRPTATRHPSRSGRPESSSPTCKWLQDEQPPAPIENQYSCRGRNPWDVGRARARLSCEPVQLPRTHHPLAQENPL
jgi:hypothetical protein